MARKTIYPRNVQIECPLQICALNRRCQEPNNCADGTGYMTIKKNEPKPVYKPQLQPLVMPVMKRAKCCMESGMSKSEPCANCPRISF